jgi:hypothetical protein
MPMLKETHALSSKMKITVNLEKLDDFSQNHVSFYMKYSSFVFRSLKRPSFQKFLSWMLRRENIDEQMVRAVHVKVFPLRRKNGKGLAGNCAPSKGKIRIYPKTLKFCRIFTQKFGKNTLLAYAGNRARAALIHELLHLKYVEDEKTVRELAKEYFLVFIQKQSAQCSNKLWVYTLIFKAKTVGKSSEQVLRKKEIEITPGLVELQKVAPVKR